MAMSRRAWGTSTRREQLPPNWAALRRAVLERDGYRCQRRIGGRIHNAYANQADHIDRGAGDHMANLQSLCDDCHRHKSAREGGEASAAARAARGLVRARPSEPHPGLR
jgi:5-methylcytosine-specific restriction enzyme A